MAFAVELSFDPKTEATIRTIWRQLAARRISTSMIDAGSRPHITLSVAREIDEAAFMAWLRHFAVQIRRFDVLFQAIGLFPTSEGVVFYAPTVTQTLLEIHQRFHEAKPDSWLDLVAYYTPGRWIPHCTAAVNLAPDQISSAIAVCKEMPLPVSGEFTGVTLVETHPRTPIRELMTLPLAT